MRPPAVTDVRGVADGVARPQLPRAVSLERDLELAVGDIEGLLATGLEPSAEILVGLHAIFHDLEPKLSAGRQQSSARGSGLLRHRQARTLSPAQHLDAARDRRAGHELRRRDAESMGDAIQREQRGTGRAALDLAQEGLADVGEASERAHGQSTRLPCLAEGRADRGTDVELGGRRDIHV